MFAKMYQLRKESVEGIQQELAVPNITDEKSGRDVSRASMTFLQKLLNDQVYLVSKLSLLYE